MNSTIVNNDTSHQHQWTLLVLSFYIQIPLCFIGFFLNVINVIVFYHNISYSSIYFLVSSLSLADAITLILRASEGLLRRNDCWPLCSNTDLRIYTYIFIIFVEVPVTNITENISNWLTLSLAVERFLAMKHLTFSKIHCTLKNFKILTIFICLLATIINFPFFISYKVNIKKETNSETNMTQNILYTEETILSESIFSICHSWIRQIIVQILPLIFLCIFSFLLLEIVYNHNRKLFKTTSCVNSTAQAQEKSKETQKLIVTPSISKSIIKEKSTTVERKLRAQKKLTILLITIILLFLIGQIPHSFAYFKIYDVLGPCKTTDDKCYQYHLFRSSTMLLTLLCYSLNFYVYLNLNTHFRQTLLCWNPEYQKPQLKTQIEMDYKPQNNLSDEEMCSPSKEIRK